MFNETLANFRFHNEDYDRLVLVGLHKREQSSFQSRLVYTLTSHYVRQLARIAECDLVLENQERAVHIAKDMLDDLTISVVQSRAQPNHFIGNSNEATNYRVRVRQTCKHSEVFIVEPVGLVQYEQGTIIVRVVFKLCTANELDIINSFKIDSLVLSELIVCHLVLGKDYHGVNTCNLI